jgi:hypothetical protein
VLHAAAESAAWDPELRSTFDFVTARSFGPPAITAECSRGFLRTDGRLIVSEPPSVGTTPVQRWDRSVLATMGFTAATPARGGDASFAVLTAVGSCPEGIPRRRGLRKRPLFR